MMPWIRNTLILTVSFVLLTSSGCRSRDGAGNNDSDPNKEREELKRRAVEAMEAAGFDDAAISNMEDIRPVTRAEFERMLRTQAQRQDIGEGIAAEFAELDYSFSIREVQRHDGELGLVLWIEGPATETEAMAPAFHDRVDRALRSSGAAVEEIIYTWAESSGGARAAGVPFRPQTDEGSKPANKSR
jgi:hypothetical protein